MLKPLTEQACQLLQPGRQIERRLGYLQRYSRMAKFRHNWVCCIILRLLDIRNSCSDNHAD